MERPPTFANQEDLENYSPIEQDNHSKPAGIYDHIQRMGCIQEIGDEYLDTEVEDFDVDNVIDKIQKKVQGQLTEDSSEPEEPVTLNQVEVDSENEYPTGEPKNIEVRVNQGPRSFIGDIFYGNFFEKHGIEQFISKEDKDLYNYQKARIIRYYILVLTFYHAVNYFIFNFVQEGADPQARVFEITFRGVLFLLLLIGIAASCWNIKLIHYCFIPLQIWELSMMQQTDSVLYLENTSERETQVLGSISIALIFVSNSFLIGEIVGNYRFIEIIVSCIVVVILFFRRLFGGVGPKPLIFAGMLFGLVGFIFTLKAFLNLEQNMTYQVIQKQLSQINRLDSLKDFQSLYQNIDLGIIVTSKGKIEQANDFFESFISKLMPQYDQSQLLDLKIFNQISKIHFSEAFATTSESFSLNDLIKKTSEFLEQNYFKVEFNKKVKYVQLSIKQIIHKDDGLSQLIQILDISDKILYTEVKSEHSFLELINAAVSHELRNPLSSLIGQVESMQDFFQNLRSVINEIKESPAVVEKLSKIQKGLENCGSKMSSACKFIDFFVHDILDYTLLNKESKNFMKDKKTFDVSVAIKEITDILNDKSSLKNIKIETHLRGFDDHYLVKTDRKRLQQVILNFLSNAIKFTDRDGKVMILVEKLFNELRVSVVDSGLGIKKKDQKRLFTMFGSIKDEKQKINVQGVGLGLVICKLIVNKFGGEVDFFSKYKKGSTFFFTFETEEIDVQPIQSRLDTEVAQNDRIMTENKGQSIMQTLLSLEKNKDARMLCIDDEEFCITALRALLFKLEVDVDSCVDFCINGQEALQMAELSKRHDFKYKMILTDFSMPVMDGLEATKRLREILGDKVPIVGVTGHASDKYQVLGQEAGMNQVVSKPLYINTLKELLNTYYK